MKKPKVKFDIQKFFVHHVEKIILVVVLGVMVWLVYAGYSLKGLEPGKTPSGLKQVSNETRTFIDDPQRWERDVKVDRPVDTNLVDLVGITQLDNDPSNYRLPQPLSQADFPKLSPRLDPKIFQPINIEVEAVVGAIASYPRSMEEMDPLYLAPPEEDADAEKKPVRKAPPPKRTARGAPPGMEDMYGGMMPPGEGGPQRGRRGRTSRGSSGSGASMMTDAGPVESAPGMMGSPYGPGEMSGMGMGMGSGLASGVNPESILGYQTTDQMAIGRHAQAIVVKAVVPFEKQVEEFLNSLGNSLDYDPQRDQPFYLGFWVERAEVPADNLEADPAMLPWAQIKVLASLYEQIGRQEGATYRPGNWAGVATDIVDPRYLDPVLTHPAPPFMQRDLWSFLTHADVPLASQMTNTMGGQNPLFPGAPKEGEKGSEPVDDLPVFPGVIPGGATGGYGSGDMSGGASGMATGMPRMPGMPGMGGGMSGGMSGGMRGPMGSPYGSGGGSGMGMGMGMGGESGYGYGSGGGEMGYGMGGAAVEPPKYKMVRFTDTHVEPGKFYRYRLKVLLHDPNHPMVGLAPPTLASLDEKVRARVRALDEADAAKKMPDGSAYRTSWITADEWSDPSPVISLPTTRQYFAGSVEQPASVAIVPGKPMVPSSQPKGKLLANVWDPEKVVDVPAEVDVFRGSILNFVQDAQVIHPVTHEVVDLEKYNFRTDAIVADLEGGDVIPPLDRKNDEPLKLPGEMLIFDASGALYVQNETEDIESFRRFLLPKPDEKAPPPGQDGMYGPGGASGVPEGYDALMMGPGSGGPPVRRPTKGGRSSRGGSGGSSSAGP